MLRFRFHCIWGRFFFYYYQAILGEYTSDKAILKEKGNLLAVSAQQISRPLEEVWAQKN